MNTRLFESLIERINESDSAFAIETYGRYVSFGDVVEFRDRQRDIASNSRIRVGLSSPSLEVIVYDIDEKSTLLFSERLFQSSERSSTRAVTPGEFLLFCDNVGPRTVASLSRIKDVILADRPDDYVGHDFAVVQSLFNPIYAIDLQSSSSCPFGVLLRELINDEVLTNELSSQAMECIQRAIDVSCVVNRALLLCMTNWSNRLAFFAIYFLLESRYFDVSAAQFHQKSQSSMARAEFYQLIEAELSWYPTEIGALEKIVRSAFDEATLTAMLGRVPECVVSDKMDPGGNLAREIYRFRNSLAHRRHATKVPREKMEALMLLMIELASRIESIAGSPRDCDCSDLVVEF